MTEGQEITETGIHRVEEMTRRSVTRLDALRARVNAGLAALLGEENARDPDQGIEDDYEAAPEEGTYYVDPGNLTPRTRR